MDFKPLSTVERTKLRNALKANAEDSDTILINPRDTSFIDYTSDEVTDDEVVAAIRSIPTHY